MTSISNRQLNSGQYNHRNYQSEADQTKDNSCRVIFFSNPAKYEFTYIFLFVELLTLVTQHRLLIARTKNFKFQIGPNDPIGVLSGVRDGTHLLRVIDGIQTVIMRYQCQVTYTQA